MSRHAYLIIAHNEFRILETLLQVLDDSRNDIYIHFDAKVEAIPDLSTTNAGLTVLQNRIDVRWADVSQIQTEILLFQEALSSGIKYSYFHLLSGVDLPIKSQDYIHSFFDSHQGKEFIGYASTAITPEIIRKACRWHLFPRHFRDGGPAIRLIRSVLLKFQEIFGLRRNKGIEFRKGANWVSVTEGMARYFVSRKDWILKTFSHTFCCDEIVMQTLCWNSPYKDFIYDIEDEWRGNMRLIGWNDGHLTDWTAGDLDTISSSSALFARKFNSSDMEFIAEVIKLTQL